MDGKSVEDRIVELERGFSRVLEHSGEDIRAELEQQATAIAEVWRVQALVVGALTLLGLLALSVLCGRLLGKAIK